MGTAAFLVALVAYNNFANRWPAFNGPLYVPLNTLGAAIACTIGIAAFGLGTRELGLAFDPVDGAVGAGTGIAIVGLLSLGLLFPGGRRLLADERVAHLTGPELLYQVAVRIPLGTALFEEIAFRGVAFGALRHVGDLEAAVISSAAFGLWHISPTLNLVAANTPGATPRRKLLTVAGAVIFTFAAGLLLVWLRVSTGSLAAPFLLHATLNSGATLLSVAAHRRRTA